MAKIVIDLDDKTYNAFMELISINLGRSNKGIIEKCLVAIKHGKVLPKGHGRLIDADKLEPRDISPEAWYSPMWGFGLVDIEDAPTIIEADREG